MGMGMGLQAGAWGCRLGAWGCRLGAWGCRLGGADRDGTSLGESFSGGVGRASRPISPVRADGGEQQRLDAVGGGVARHLRAVSSQQSEVGGQQSEVGSAQKVASGER